MELSAGNIQIKHLKLKTKHNKWRTGQGRKVKCATIFKLDAIQNRKRNKHSIQLTLVFYVNVTSVIVSKHTLLRKQPA